MSNGKWIVADTFIQHAGTALGKFRASFWSESAARRFAHECGQGAHPGESMFVDVFFVEEKEYQVGELITEEALCSYDQ